MPDQSLEIAIRMVLEGDGAKLAATDIDKLKEASKQMGAEGERARYAIAKLQEEAKQMGPAGDEAREALKKLGDESEESAHKHNNLVTVIKGAKAEIPGLGLVLHALQHPILLIGAAIGITVGKILEYIAHVDEMAKKSREFDTIGERVASVTRLQYEQSASARQLARDYDDVAAKLNTATARMDEWNAVSARHEQIIATGHEKELARDLAVIDAAVAKGTMTEIAAIAAREKAESEARHRKEKAEEDKLTREIAHGSMAELNAQKGAEQAQADVNALRPQLAPQERKARITEAQAKNIEESQGEELKNLEGRIETMKRIAENKWSIGTEIPGYGKARLQDSTLPPMVELWGEKGREKARELLEKMEGEREVINAKIESANKLAALERDKASRLKEEHDVAARQLIENKAQLEQLKKKNAQLAEELGDIKKANASNRELDDQTAKIKADTATRQKAAEAFKQAWEHGAPVPGEVAKMFPSAKLNPNLPSGVQLDPDAPTPRRQFEQTPIDPGLVAYDRTAGKRSRLEAGADRAYREVADALESGNMQGARAWDEILKAQEKELALLLKIFPALQRHTKRLDEINSSADALHKYGR